MERIQKIKDFLQLSPEDSFLQHALALEYIKVGDDTTAKDLFEMILKREPGYIGSYYHLGKLLERMGRADDATRVYEKGMGEAKKAGDQHAYDELKSAYEELTF